MSALNKNIYNRLLSSQSGITIIEVIISVSLLAVGILGLLQAFPTGIEASKNVEFATIADQFAQAKIEELVNANYDALVPGILEDQVHVKNDPADPFYKFLRSSAVELVDSSLNASAIDIGLKKIIVTIYWPSILGGSNRSVQLTQLKSKR